MATRRSVVDRHAEANLTSVHVIEWRRDPASARKHSWCWRCTHFATCMHARVEECAGCACPLLRQRCMICCGRRIRARRTGRSATVSIRGPYDWWLSQLAGQSDTAPCVVRQIDR
eukprot:2809327-Pleurochrysis_carterae.AAC.4